MKLADVVNDPSLSNDLFPPSMWIKMTGAKLTKPMGGSSIKLNMASTYYLVCGGRALRLQLVCHPLSYGPHSSGPRSSH